MLLAVNIASINLAARSVLFWRGIRPRTFFENNKKAGRGRIVSGLLWVALLALLAGLMWWRVTA